MSQSFKNILFCHATLRIDYIYSCLVCQIGPAKRSSFLGPLPVHERRSRKGRTSLLEPVRWSGREYPLVGNALPLLDNVISATIFVVFLSHSIAIIEVRFTNLHVR